MKEHLYQLTFNKNESYYLNYESSDSNRTTSFKWEKKKDPQIDAGPKIVSCYLV